MTSKGTKPTKEKKKESFGEALDASMDSMEETRFRKKHQALIGKLSKKLHFSFTELECLLLIYYKVQKDNRDAHQSMNKAQFRDIMHSCLDMTDDKLMDRIFFSLDKGPSSLISMETWASTLSLFLRGTLEEKMKFCFSVYDSMGDGFLGKESMFNLLKNSIVSPTSDEDAEESAKDMIEVITKKMDIDRDGKISFNDYKQTVLKQPMMLEAFGQCLPSRQAVYAFINTFTPDIGKM